jgi:hypothetical protein
MKNIFTILNISKAVVVVGAVLLLNQFIYLLPVHIGAFVVTITGVILADLYALLWVIGKFPTLQSRYLTGLHYVVGTGLLVSITSGFLMFWPLREYLVTVEAFWVKVVFVMVLIINSFVISAHMHIHTTQTFSSLSKTQRLPLFLSGATSAISWVTVFVAALLLNV